MREVERLAGLALAGRATIGPLRLRTPALLEARATGEAGEGPSVTSGSAAPGMRRVVLGDGTNRLELEAPILAPEIVPAGTGVVPLGSGAALLHAPLDETALRELRGHPPELLVLGNARTLWNDGEALVGAIHQVRTEVGGEPLLWAPRLALPNRLPLLAYLGFDIVDTTEGELRAAAGEFLDPTLGPRRLDSAETDRGCDCSACNSSPRGSLVDHARTSYRRAALELRAAIARGTLRELVEARLASEPATAELLRYADRDLGGLLESRTPVTSSESHTYVLAEALRRPEMRRFRERLLERYRPPPSKSVLLLVPCSRTKPYRRSPSHRRFVGAFEDLVGAQRVHVVSISSPIGVVPRELEDVPPARNYDIPVTGEWSAEEREVVLRGLRHLLDSGSYRHVLLHLDPEEYGFVVDAVPAAVRGPVTVADARPTSPASVGRLRESLLRALDDAPKLSGGPLQVVAEELREVASVQFGRLAAERLFARPLRLAGRPWFQRVTDGRQDLASLREERGLFHLTVAGALRLGETLARVDVDPTLSLEGDLFAPGVVRADPAVRTGDAVGLYRDGQLAAVGEAVLPGPLLGDLRRGLAIRVRHRHHQRADIAKTVENPPPAGR
jgi:archaeosine synthase alpha-subunit